MPELFKLLARNGIAGVAAGWATLGFFLLSNVGGLGDVVFASSNPFLPLMLLALGFTITFGSLAMGAAIMMLPYDGDAGKGRGLKIHTWLASMKEKLPRFAPDRDMVLVPLKDDQDKHSLR